MNEFPQLNAGKPLNIGQIRLCQISNRADARGGQLFRRGTSDGKQRTDWQRPEFLRDFVCKKRVHLIRLFKVAGHLRQQLVWRNTDIDSKAQFRKDRILDDMRDGSRVGIEKTGSGHV